MKTMTSTLLAALAAMTCSAVPAPSSLKGAEIELDYTHAEFSTEVLEGSHSGWVSYGEALQNVRGSAVAFRVSSCPVKATRRLLPLSDGGEGGIYTYTCRGGDIGEIDVDMPRALKAHAVRSITLTFDSPTTAEAEEAIYCGLFIGSVRHIRAKIRPAGQVDVSRLSQLRSGIEARAYRRPLERHYQRRLLTLLHLIEKGAAVNVTGDDTGGASALHLACELSEVELVQWLVDHGADVELRTKSGASVDDCVCGANAAAIRAILRKTRQNK